MKFFNFDKIRKEIKRNREITRIKGEIIKYNNREIEARLSVFEKMLKFSEEFKRNTR